MPQFVLMLRDTGMFPSDISPDGFISKKYPERASRNVSIVHMNRSSEPSPVSVLRGGIVSGVWAASSSTTEAKRSSSSSVPIRTGPLNHLWAESTYQPPYSSSAPPTRIGA